MHFGIFPRSLNSDDPGNYRFSDFSRNKKMSRLLQIIPSPVPSDSFLLNFFFGGTIPKYTFTIMLTNVNSNASKKRKENQINKRIKCKTDRINSSIFMVATIFSLSSFRTIKIIIFQFNIS